ncbi:hypothetical protein GQ43DRAFT_168254 [Delitschia confertaspora ATCC 74209]|uniref:Polysaccharide export protein n=1 Tax=Delitschia confertaspora ATCC 74209 TaxID=1513339 RepID=A0A9P4MVS4_9PLEO|nr:hypothetical protein GQ43DRAFT_168254 [Delitschia confertaspora ATCC 74209]
MPFRFRFRPFQRLSRQRFLRIFLLVLLLWDTVKVIQIHSAQSAALHPTERPPNTRRIYIASQHWNNEKILQSRWNEAVIELVKTLGPDNVFVSVFESGSWDNTKGALRELDRTLGELRIKRNITLSDISHKDEISRQPTSHGWIETPRGKKELRRIPFLATLRNHVLEPLDRLSNEGITFDNILFLNDVVFTVDDVLTLLDTNNGDYAAACSLDFSKPPLFYDTFALRDSGGHEAVMSTWPFFRSRTSRHAMELSRPVPVTSCWNGMVSMPAAPFISKDTFLRFRALPDPLALHHLEASECCLIHADNPLSLTKPIYVNPKVRVGYSVEAYKAMHTTYAEFSTVQIFKAIWWSRLIRWTTTPAVKEMVVKRRIERWKSEGEGREEKGGFCVVNEMQVIVGNGWKHV